MWIYVIARFTHLLAGLDMTLDQRNDAKTKSDGIARKLWATFWTGDFNSDVYMIVGGYGKDTAIRPPSDVDLAVMLPSSVYDQLQRVQGNKQSYLLRLVKDALIDRYPATEISQDGQIVAVDFQAYKVEVLPFFYDNSTESCRFADTNDGGHWRICQPWAEIDNLDAADRESRKKARHLVKMLKAWKRRCNVPIESFALELLVSDFVWSWEHRNMSLFYYDWLVRDFFEFFLRNINRTLTIPGSPGVVNIGDAWYSRAESALSRACKACDAERDDDDAVANVEWGKIFGPYS